MTPDRGGSAIGPHPEPVRARSPAVSPAAGTAAEETLPDEFHLGEWLRLACPRQGYTPRVILTLILACTGEGATQPGDGMGTARAALRSATDP